MKREKKDLYIIYHNGRVEEKKKGPNVDLKAEVDSSYEKNCDLLKIWYWNIYIYKVIRINEVETKILNNCNIEICN